MTPSLPDLIRQHGLHANKKLGQHFLTDPHLLADIVAQAGLETGTHVIEIGPGPGGLTRALLATDIAGLTTVELDARCLPILEELRADDPRLEIIHGDALTTRLDALCPAPRAVVANLPYNVGTRILLHFLRQIAEAKQPPLTAITVMLQQEVAQRITAPPGGRDYGRLSVLCQWLCEVDHRLDVSPEAFTPPPKVMSSVIRLVPRPTPYFPATFKVLESFLTAAFGQRRKMLRKALKPWRSDAENWLQQCGIDPTRRAETLTLEEIGRLVVIPH